MDKTVVIIGAMILVFLVGMFGPNIIGQLNPQAVILFGTDLDGARARCEVDGPGKIYQSGGQYCLQTGTSTCGGAWVFLENCPGPTGSSTTGGSSELASTLPYCPCGATSSSVFCPNKGAAGLTYYKSGDYWTRCEEGTTILGKFYSTYTNKCVGNSIEGYALSLVGQKDCVNGCGSNGNCATNAKYCLSSHGPTYCEQVCDPSDTLQYSTQTQCEASLSCYCPGSGGCIKRTGSACVGAYDREMGNSCISINRLGDTKARSLCEGTVQTHSECIDEQCIEVDGPGSNECSSDEVCEYNLGVESPTGQCPYELSPDNIHCRCNSQGDCPIGYLCKEAGYKPIGLGDIGLCYDEQTESCTIFCSSQGGTGCKLDDCRGQGCVSPSEGNVLGYIYGYECQNKIQAGDKADIIGGAASCESGKMVGGVCLSDKAIGDAPGVVGTLKTPTGEWAIVQDPSKLAYATSYTYQEFMQMSGPMQLSAACRYNIDCKPYEDLSGTGKVYNIQCSARSDLLTAAITNSKSTCDKYKSDLGVKLLGGVSVCAAGSAVGAIAGCAVGVAGSGATAFLGALPLCMAGGAAGAGYGALLVCPATAAAITGMSAIERQQVINCELAAEEKLTGICIAVPKGETIGQPSGDIFAQIDSGIKSVLPDNAKQYSGLLILAFIVIVILALIAPRR